MEASVINTLIAGGVGLVSGAIGSLIAPWVQWGVEKRRKRYEKRVKQIEQWKELIWSETFDRFQLIRHPSYSSLQGLLSKETRWMLESSTHVIEIGSPFDPYQRALLKEIHRIEKSWGLI